MKYYMLSVRRKKLFLAGFILTPLVPFFISIILINDITSYSRYFIFAGFLSLYEWMLEYFTQFNYYGGKKINNFTFFLTSEKGLSVFRKIINGNSIRRTINYLYYFFLCYLVILYEGYSGKALSMSILFASFTMMYLFELIMERILISFADVVYLYIFMSFLPILGFSMGSVMSLTSTKNRMTISIVLLIIILFSDWRNNKRIYKKALLATKR